ncbi:MAG: hypothetical protein PHO84_06385 [Dysgonamonadaceae bacterium]|nr:hypothetical protein [Dysgonamonadaceae bacterium]
MYLILRLIFLAFKPTGKAPVAIAASLAVRQLFHTETIIIM